MENKFLAVNKDYFNKGLKSIDILIIAQIDEYRRNGHDCYVTNEQFAEMFGDSRETIKRSLTKLENMNIVSRKTTFIEGNGRSNRQRVLSINDKSQWKAQNEPTIMEGSNKWKAQIPTMEGSNIDNGRLKSCEWKAQSEPIKDNKKNNIKENKKKTLISISSNDEEKSSLRSHQEGEIYDLAEIEENKKEFEFIQKCCGLKSMKDTIDFVYCLIDDYTWTLDEIINALKQNENFRYNKYKKTPSSISYTEWLHYKMCLFYGCCEEEDLEDIEW